MRLDSASGSAEVSLYRVRRAVSDASGSGFLLGLSIEEVEPPGPCDRQDTEAEAARRYSPTLVATFVKPASDNLVFIDL